ncbi:TetR family transcriptional regulator [Streptomyces sp. NPDC101132]|uniref:TetR family transcriptional regulator n=1 Tax=Streptomyces sp. NPDC101132 TaxID=3366110 RepID=UPI00382D0C7A
MNTTTEPLTLRERKKAQTRQAIQDHALRLFLTKGYDSTTVQEIAEAVGISHMTFFRYFPTKEAVVENDDYDPLIATLIEQRPPHEDTLTALRHALATGLRTVYAHDRQALLVRTRLILTTPALRDRMWANQYSTQRLFVDALRRRRPTESLLATRVQAAAALAALTTTLTVWVEGDGGEDLPTLVDSAFSALLDQPRQTSGTASEPG